MRKLRLIVEEEHPRTCCWCCYHPAIMTFVCGVVIITFVGGCVLWEFGILQPILSQCIVYIYIMLVLVAFVALIVSKLWTVCRSMVDFLICEFGRLKDVFKIFGKRQRFGKNKGEKAKGEKAFDFFEDNVTSGAEKHPLGALGERRRARAQARRKQQGGCLQC